MALNQQLIDSVATVNQAFIDNADWFPGDLVKLKAMIDAYSQALALRPSLASHGGSSAEEIRFALEVNAAELNRLRETYLRLLSRSNKRGGFRQHQLTQDNARWS